MTQTYKQIAKQIASLQKQADKLREDEMKEVVAQIKATIAEYGLTASDLGLSAGRVGRPSAKSAGRKKHGGEAEPKFRDAAGNTWGGRGPRPAWLREQLDAGKALEDFLA